MRSEAELARLAETLTDEVRAAIARGEDPLGDAFIALRVAEKRRARGATYTPAAIVDAMLAWVTEAPARVVDPGCGSGRFLVAAGRRFPEAELVGYELDPLAARLCLAHLAAAGLRGTVIVGDFRAARPPAT